MPSCLKCGKSIEPGNNYCDDCGDWGEAQVQKFFGIVEGSKYKPRRRSKYSWLIIGFVMIGLIMVVVSVFLVLSIPTSTEFKTKAKATMCRNNMENVEEAIEWYHKVENKYPPTGKLDENHPLIYKNYLDSVPICSATKHEYMLVTEDSKVVVICESGIEEHRLEDGEQ